MIVRNHWSHRDAGTLPRIDLNAERREERSRILRRSRRHGLGLIAMVLIALPAVVPLTRHVISQKRQARAAERQTRDIARCLQSVTAADAQMEAEDSRWDRYVRSRDGRRAWSDLLETLTATVPDHVFLQQVQITTRGAGAEIALQGSAETMDGLRAFTASLAQAPVFQNVRLTETAADHTLGAGGVAFKMTGPLNGVGIGAAGS